MNAENTAGQNRFWGETTAFLALFLVLPLVAVIDPDFVAIPSPDEVAEVFEVPLAYLMDMRHLRARPVDWGGNTRSVLEYDWPGQRIWGATAAMLANLHQRLQQA